MNKLLSQGEVDSLLKGLDTGEVDVIQDFDDLGEDLESFDWATRGLNVRGNMPLLEVVNSRFAQRLRGSISTSLRKMVDVTPDPLETIKYGDFQRSLPVPTSMQLFKIEPLRGTGILVIESRLVFSLVEAYFGGSGAGSTKIEGREFTPIENRVIQKVVHMALTNLMEAWEDVHPIKTEFVRSESNPLVVNIVPGEELLISTKFEIDLNRPMGTIIVCFPYSSYQPIRDKLSGGYRDEEEVSQLDQAWINSLHEKLIGTEVGITANLGRTHLTVKDFLNLKTGDIIVLENDFKAPLIAEADGIPLYKGYAGRYRNKKVFKVEQPIISRA
ncbi:MAG: flagellar motor switch protein FliM [Deltaproteobacteria bacterium]|nr:flagellar motor switch protein FliM [Deltaproteobacteria bacterium]